MKNTYFDLIEQSYYFPQEGFDLQNEFLTFHGVSLKHLIEKHGTPFRFIYLPKIGDQIKKARNLFNRAINNHAYRGKYNFCYCTKCNHFYHVVNKALEHQVDLETSSSFDINLIFHLHQQGKLDLKRKVVHNGYKTDDYLQKIIKMQEAGFENSILVLDSIHELDRVLKLKPKKPLKVGLRMAINEEAQSAYYTSRLGIPYGEMMKFYKNKLAKCEQVELKMLHFFVDSGIKDTPYYWREFRRALELYVGLKKESKSLDSLNLGGGFPIRNNLGFEYNYEYMINEIISNIKAICNKENVLEPDIFTEFGKYTVGEAGAIIFQVLEQKQQNDNEKWYIIDNSLMNTIPDAWSIQEKFILLPINKWQNEYSRANIGGISCDHSDYYNFEDFNQEVLLPNYADKDKDPLYLGFFHTGAYQDSVSGYGGIKHCLIPSPKHVIIDRDERGNIVDTVYREEQSVDEMLSILGYKKDE